MTVSSKQLIAGVQIPASLTELYTAVNVTTRFDAMTVCNTTASAVTFSIDIVESGESAGVTKRVISAKSVAAGQTYRCPEVISHVLEAGGSVYGIASSASALTIIASGREET